MKPKQIKLKRYTAENAAQSAPHIYKMAKQLKQAGEVTAISFSVACSFVAQSIGCFYTASIKGKVVGYACFAYSDEWNELRRLQYFAVSARVQGKGLGVEILRAIMSQEMPSPDGELTVACKSDLVPFYEKAGFMNAGQADGSKDIVLTFSNTKGVDPASIRKKKVTSLIVNLKDVISSVPNLEREFNIDLSSDLPIGD